MNNRAVNVIRVKRIKLLLTKALSNQPSAITGNVTKFIGLAFENPLTSQNLTTSSGRLGNAPIDLEARHRIHLIVHGSTPMMRFRANIRLDLPEGHRLRRKGKININRRTEENLPKLQSLEFGLSEERSPDPLSNSGQRARPTPIRRNEVKNGRETGKRCGIRTQGEDGDTEETARV